VWRMGTENTTGGPSAAGTRPGPRVDSSFTFDTVLDELEAEFLRMPLMDILGAARLGGVGTRFKRDRAIDAEIKLERDVNDGTAAPRSDPALKDFRADFAIDRLARRMIERDFKSRTHGATLKELEHLLNRSDPPTRLVDAIDGIAKRVMLKALTEAPIRLQRIRMLLWALHPNAMTQGSSLRPARAGLVQDDLRKSLGELNRYRDAYSRAFRRYGLETPADMDLLHALGAFEDGFVVLATILLSAGDDESTAERRDALAALFAKATVGVVCALYPAAKDARVSLS
jgi:hypothetical protein